MNHLPNGDQGHDRKATARHPSEGLMRRRRSVCRVLAKTKKVSNANYLWLSYIYSYLNSAGRAGVVMCSQASGAGRAEATVRQKMLETVAAGM